MPTSADPRRGPLVPVRGPLPNGRPHGGGPRGRQTNLVVVDPIPLFIEGLRALLTRTPAIRALGTAATPQTALNLCDRAKPDVVLVDAVLDPSCQFARALASAAHPGPAPTILFVLREPLRNARFLSAAAGSGVSGFVLRSANPTRFIEAIRRAHLEGRYLDPDLAALSGGPQVRHLVPSTPSTRQPLSRREHEVLRLVAEGMENQEIGDALFVSVETIRTHVKSILRKLHTRDRAHAVAVAFRLGVLLPFGDDQPDDTVRPITSSSGHEHGRAASLARVTSR